jgi:DNA segregation ATPase FtsK/SpoIIIE, S-DNA-T family
MVLGDGVGYVRLEGSPHVVRIRAAYVSDDDIRAMTETAADHCEDADGDPWTE